MGMEGEKRQEPLPRIKASVDHTSTSGRSGAGQVSLPSVGRSWRGTSPTNKPALSRGDPGQRAAEEAELKVMMRAPVWCMLLLAC